MAKGKYTLLHEDESHFLMQHPNGNHFKVAKSAVSNITKGEIQKFSEGSADVEPVEEQNETPAESQQVMSPAISNWDALKKGLGEIPGAIQYATEPFQDLHDKAQGFWSGLDKAGRSIWPGSLPTDDIKAETPSASVDTAAPASAPSAPDARNVPPGQPQQPAPTSAPPAPVNNGNGLYPFENQTLQGLKEKQQADTAQGSAIAKIQGDLATNLAMADWERRDKSQKYNDQMDALYKEASDPKNAISANKYWEKQGTSGRIMSAIGMLLGGIGQGLMKSNRNLVVDNINTAIDRDIDAQKANASNRNSLFQKNLEMVHNINDATALTKSGLQSVALAMASKALGENSGPQAQAAYDQMAGQLKGEYMSRNIGIANQQAALKMINGFQSADPNGQADPAKKLELLHYLAPNIVGPEQYKTGNEEIGLASKTNAAHAAADNIFKQLSQEQTIGNRVMSPLQSSQRIKALSAQLIPLLMESNPSKRLTEESLRTELEPFITKLSTDRTTQRKNLAGVHQLINTHAADTPTLRGLGIGTPKYNTINTGAVNQSKLPQ